MRKVIVNCVVEYSYAAEVPDDLTLEDESQIISEVDGQDPVYQIIRQKTSNVVGEICSVVDAETNEVLSEL